MAEYSPAAMVVLIHSFYVERQKDLRWALYQHSLRWSRFCKSASVMAAMRPTFEAGLQQLKAGIETAAGRAAKLAGPVDQILATPKSPPLPAALELADCDLYLRELVAEFQSTRELSLFCDSVRSITARFVGCMSHLFEFRRHKIFRRLLLSRSPAILPPWQFLKNKARERALRGDEG